MVGDVLGAQEVRRQQLLLQPCLHLGRLRERQVEQPVRVGGVRTLCLGEPERAGPPPPPRPRSAPPSVDRPPALRRTSRPGARQLSGSAPSALTGRAGRSGRRCRRPCLRSSLQRRSSLRGPRGGLLQPALPDVAPRADDVAPDLDQHVRRTARSGWVFPWGPRRTRAGPTGWSSVAGGRPTTPGVDPEGTQGAPSGEASAVSLMCAGALRRHCSRHDQGRVTHTEVRRLHRRRQHHVHGAARSRHRVPRAQRSRQVHDDAGHGRAHPADVRHRDDRRAPVRRTAQHGPGGRRPPRRLRAARGPHRPRDPHPRPADDGPAPEPGGRDAGAGQPHADRSGSPRAQLLAGHAAAPRDRHRADRRAGGPDPRRAGQRPRPGRHPLDARPSPRLRRPGRHRAAARRTCCTRSR